ncbi:MAG: hypothetical protein K2X87_31755 [Gemmataceae bacterium]|nr:hypothetical protein [Gemmataceae bacterium]
MRAIMGAVAVGVLAILTPPAAGRADDADPFEEGAAWEGKRFTDGGKQDWQLKVTERDAKKGTFKGEMSITRADNTTDTYKVDGKATAKAKGAVSFKSEKKGFFQQSFTGKLNGGEVAMTWGGKTRAGGDAKGTATLKPKN